MIGDIKKYLSATPFVPFSIRVADGREYRVPTPDHAHVQPAGTRVSIYSDEGFEAVLPPLLISGVILDQMQISAS